MQTSYVYRSSVSPYVSVQPQWAQRENRQGFYPRICCVLFFAFVACAALDSGASTRIQNVRCNVHRKSEGSRRLFFQDGTGSSDVTGRQTDKVKQTCKTLNTPFTRSSKRPANAFKRHVLTARRLLEICWTFAGSCKHAKNMLPVVPP